MRDAYKAICVHFVLEQFMHMMSSLNYLDIICGQIRSSG
jgi:hypothetical protein